MQIKKPPEDPEQSKRFIEAARLAEADEDLEALDRAFARLDIKAKSPSGRRPNVDAPKASPNDLAAKT